MFVEIFGRRRSTPRQPASASRSAQVAQKSSTLLLPEANDAAFVLRRHDGGDRAHKVLLEERLAEPWHVLASGGANGKTRRPGGNQRPPPGPCPPAHPPAPPPRPD